MMSYDRLMARKLIKSATKTRNVALFRNTNIKISASGGAR